MGVSLKNVKMEVITDESQAGEGFAAFSDVYPQATDAKHRERVKRGISEGQVTAKRLIRTTKDIENGEIYIHLQQAQAWLSSEMYDRDTALRGGAKQMRLRASVNEDRGEQFSQVISVLGRIADALENLATRPETDPHTPFGDLLHASTNGDR